MNLMSLFNFKYFMQNLKKSKSSIVFMLLLLPIFSMLNLIANNSSERVVLLDFASLNVFNIIFMYVIPIALSITLFNFVYKKNSADFIGSMPLSRKTIFASNTVYGALLLILLQLVTALLITLLASIFSNIIVLNGLIWDSFIYYSIAYIFVFVVCNLAMSFSGNMFATIATTMLILFLVPFTITLANVKNSYNEIYTRNIDTLNGTITFYEKNNFTAPSYIFDVIYGGNMGFEYSTASLVKMLILSIVYFAIGYKLFNKKKYEMAGESFETDNVHLVVKLLTLAPFMIFALDFDITEDTFAFLFLLAIIAAYYFLFDVITNKKIKFKVSIVTFLASVALMYGFYSVIVPKLNFINKRVVNVNNDVKNVKIVSINGGHGGEAALNLNIDNQDVIEDLLLEEEYSSKNEYTTRINMIVETKNGKKYDVSKYGVSLQKLLDNYGNKPFEFEKANYVANLRDVALTKTEEKELKNQMFADVSGKTIKEYVDILFDKSELYEAYLVAYKDHRFISSTMNYSGFKKATEYSIKLLNDHAYLNIGKVHSVNIMYEVDLRNYMLKVNPELSNIFEAKKAEAEKERMNEKYYSYYNDYLDYSSSVDYDTSIIYPITREGYLSDLDSFIGDILYSGVRNIDLVELNKYVKERRNDTFDSNKPYYSIRCFGDASVWFYSNDLEGFYKLIAKAYNMLEYNDGIVLNENV